MIAKHPIVNGQRRVRRAALSGLVVAAAVLPASCGGDDSDAGASGSTESDTADAATTEGEGAQPSATAAGDPTATLRLAGAPIPTQWDPVQSLNDQLDWAFLTPVYDRLIMMSPKLQLKPMLATDWKIAADRRSMTLSLRKGVTFQDGEPVDAAAVKANFDRILAAEGTLARRAVDDVMSANVVDEYTVELELSGDGTVAELPMVLAMYPQLSLVSPAAMNDPESLATNPVGAGPYRLAEHVQNRVVFEKYDGYWDEEIVQNAPARIEYTSMVDKTAAVNALLSGQVDMISILDPTDAELDTVSQTMNVTVFPPNHKTQWMIVNLDRPPLDDPNVRRALSLSLDRTALASLAAEGTCVGTPQVSVEGTVGYVDELDTAEVTSPDLDEARRLLDEAGADGMTLKLVSSSFPSSLERATAYQAQLEQAGVNVEITSLSAPEALSAWLTGDYDLFSASSAGGADPGIQLGDWWAYGPNALGGAPKELTTLLDEARSLPLGSDERDQAFQEVNRYLVESPRNLVSIICGTAFGSAPNVVGMERQTMGQFGTVLDPRYIWIAAD